MSLQNDLFTYLTGTPAVADLFPGGIYHESLPQEVKVWPAMSFFQAAQTEIAADMEQPNDAKLDEHLYQFDVFADNSDASISAANTFLGIFRNFRGTMTATRIQMVSLTNVSHIEERRGDKLRRRVSLDFSITIDV